MNDVLFILMVVSDGAASFGVAATQNASAIVPESAVMKVIIGHAATQSESACSGSGTACSLPAV
jgi:hypothetical protein